MGDGAVDEGAALGCQDAWANGDGDNFGAGPAQCVCPGTPGYAQQSGDCDDNDASVPQADDMDCDGVLAAEDCDDQDGGKKGIQGFVFA